MYVPFARVVEHPRLAQERAALAVARQVAAVEAFAEAYFVEGRLVKIDVRKTTANGVGNLVGAAVYGVKP